jgi:uncharacterized protein YegP (UPF0339 family)
VIAMVPGRGAERTRWHLVARTGVGADVLAHAVVPASTDPGRGRAEPWRATLRSLRDGDGVMTIAATGDGHFRWVLTGSPGGVIAESPGVYRDAESCRQGFRAAQEAARLALGGRRHDPRTAYPGTRGEDPR